MRSVLNRRSQSQAKRFQSNLSWFVGCAAVLMVSGCGPAGAQEEPASHWMKIPESPSAICHDFEAVTSEYNLSQLKTAKFDAALGEKYRWNWDIFPKGAGYESKIAPLSDKNLVDEIGRRADLVAAFEYGRRLHRSGKDDLALRYLALGLLRFSPREIVVSNNDEILYSREHYPSWGYYAPSVCLAQVLCGARVVVHPVAEPDCKIFE